MDNLKTIILVLVIFLLMLPVINEGLKRNEKAECYRWQEQAKTIKGFYLSPAEQAQCDHFNIKVIQ